MKAIPGFSGYFISRDGKVYSDRQAGGGGGRKADMHLVVSTKKGHKYQRIVLMKDGKKTTRYIHDLVVSAFGGDKQSGQQVRHLDGNVDHNNPKNLKPGTAKENGEDRSRHMAKAVRLFVRL